MYILCKSLERNYNLSKKNGSSRRGKDGRGKIVECIWNFNVNFLDMYNKGKRREWMTKKKLKLIDYIHHAQTFFKQKENVNLVIIFFTEFTFINKMDSSLGDDLCFRFIFLASFEMRNRNIDNKEIDISIKYRLWPLFNFNMKTFPYFTQP